MTHGRRVAALIVLVLVLGASLTPAVVAGAVDPRFEAHAAETVITPGGTERVTVTFTNDAQEPDDRAEPATNVEVEMRPGGTPFTVVSGPRHLGTLRDGRPTPATFAIQVPPDVSAGTYDVPIQVTYEHDRDERETTTVHVQLRLRDRAEFAVVQSDGSVSVGDDGSVTVTVENVGSEPARDASVTLSSKSSALALGGDRSAARYVGAWPVGERRNLTYSITARPSAEPRPYPLVATVAYDDTDGRRQQSAPLSGSIAPSPEQTFTISTMDARLQVGRDGRATLAVTNPGNETVTGATLELVATGPNLTPTQVRYPVGTLAPGETATTTLSLHVAPESTAGDRQLTARVSYNDDDGDRLAGGTHLATVSVARAQRFDVAVRSGGLRAGRDGQVTLLVTNIGPRAVEAANLRLGKTPSAIHPEQTTYALGTLRPGETTTATLRFEVTDGATPTPRLFTARVAYDDADGDRVTAGPSSFRVDVAPEEPRFHVQVVDATVPAGGTSTVTVRVTNEGDETLHGVDARAYTDAPLSVPDDTAYVDELEPGASSILRFGVSAPGDALLKKYPISMDFQYRDPEGETELSDPHDIPVSVIPGEGALDRVVDLLARLRAYRGLLTGGLAGVAFVGLVLGAIRIHERWRDDG